ncbi:MAG: hypothetical protein RIC87_02475 [Kiloniellales bacterium]
MVKLGAMTASIKHPQSLLFCLTVCLGIALPLLAPASAQVLLENDWRGERHMNCLRSVERDPSYGMSLAEDWIRQTGTSAARHCMAVAESAIGDPGKAAEAFGLIAQQLPGDRWSDIGQLWAQAGHAWLLAEESRNALEAFDLAVDYRPNDAGLLADRGVTRALLQDYRGTVADMTRAIELSGGNPDYLLYRATAYRYLDDLRRGLIDLDAAVLVAPGFADVYMERGRQRALVGDIDGAAADFRQVLQLAPNSRIAPLAEDALRQVSGD